MNSQDEQIAWLNTVIRVKVAPSKIHGVGLHAMRFVGKGTKMYLDASPKLYTVPYSSFGKLFDDVRAYLLGRWPRVVTGSGFFYPEAALMTFCNHSDNPNYDAYSDTTLRDIKEGEEITEDYRTIEGWGQVFPWLDKKKGVL